MIILPVLLARWNSLPTGRMSTKASHSAVSSWKPKGRSKQIKIRCATSCVHSESKKARCARLVPWVAEKVGRARLIVAGDEPGRLGLVLTLEGLIMGVTGKKLLWVALAATKLPRLDSYNFEQLQRRAEQQAERIEAERISSVR